MGTQERLLEATITLLSRVGYAGVTTRAIVAEAQAALPSVNYYFGSKDALMSAAVAEALRRWGQTTMAVIDSGSASSLRERIDHSVHRFITTLGSDRAYVVAALEALAQAERDDDIRQALATSYVEFRDIVASYGNLPQAGPNHPPDRKARVLASLMIALFDGLAIQWLLDPLTAASAAEILAGLDMLAGAWVATEAPA